MWLPVRSYNHSRTAKCFDCLNILPNDQIEPAAFTRRAKESYFSPLLHFVIKILQMLDEDIRSAIKQRHFVIRLVFDPRHANIELVIPLSNFADREDYRYSVVVTISQCQTLHTGKLLLGFARRLELGFHSHGEADVGTHSYRRAVSDLDGSGLGIARFVPVTRPSAMYRSRARVAGLAVIGRHRGGLTQDFLAGFFTFLSTQKYMAARHAIGMKPPVVRLRHFRA